MKAILEFDLNDPDDRIAHLRAVKSLDMSLVLWEMENNCYKKITTDEDENMYTQGVIETLEHLRNLMDKHNINLDELII